MSVNPDISFNIKQQSFRLHSSEIFLFFLSLLIFISPHPARDLLLEELLNVFSAFIRLIGLKRPRFNSHIGLKYLTFSRSHWQR